MGERVSGLRATAVLLALTLACAPLASCRSSSPAPRARAGEVVHEVKRGENLYRIARHYGVPVERVVRANRIRDVRRVMPGMRLRIPGAKRGVAQTALRPPTTTAARRARASGLAFQWPVRGTLTSQFGRRWGRQHEGIDLANRTGTPVRAAEHGKVIYSGSGLGAYGNVVILRHRDGWETVYAHNRKNRVRKGARVERGQVIAELGASGNATGPHLHFEIRHDDRARDPLKFLR